jgi:hypothetical protein
MPGGSKTLREADNLESIPQITKRLGWRLYLGVVLYTIVILLVTMRWCPTFYWSLSAAVGVIAVAIIRFWAFSRRLWFWATIVLMAMLQIPLVFTTNQWADRYKGSFIFLFMLLDFFVIDAVVRWVSPELGQAQKTAPD